MMTRDPPRITVLPSITWTSPLGSSVAMKRRGEVGEEIGVDSATARRS